MAGKNMTQIRDIGERGLLSIVQKYCPPEIIGDDGAILSLSSHRNLAVTTDVLVDGVHFSDRTTSAEDVGWRAIAANLSDLAAMGAQPIGITVGLSLPPDLSVAWVEGLYRGMSECAELYRTSIVGGDLCRSSTIAVAITALGEVEPTREIRRDLAQIGDYIVITGKHGASRAGLALLIDPELGKNLTEEDRLCLILAHQRPRPRLDVLSHLQNITNSRRVAGMDSSDGLADAVLQICDRSGVGAEIELVNVPLLSSLLDLVGVDRAWEWTFYGGEDFELVLCLPPDAAIELLEKLGERAAIIGRIVAGAGVVTIDANRRIAKLEDRSFQHFCMT
jgi:thiamine-monophosphate kinase